MWLLYCHLLNLMHFLFSFCFLGLGLIKIMKRMVSLVIAAFYWLLAMGWSDSSGIREAIEKCDTGSRARGCRSFLHSILHNHQLLLVGETAMQSSLQGVGVPPRFIYAMWLYLISGISVKMPFLLKQMQ